MAASRFDLRRHLGTGGMGVVYEAYDNERRQSVALKKLLGGDPAAIYRLKKEFRSLADLAHPNLISLYELIHEEGEWFFTMELVDGVDFLTCVSGDAVPVDHGSFTQVHTVRDPARPRKARMGDGDDDDDAEQPVTMLRPPRQPADRPARSPCPARLDILRDVLRQLTEGVAAVHRAGKLHRDLKPSNVLVTPKGRVVVLDFGVVVDLVSSRHQTLAGTPTYMAPEQVADQPAMPATDWYALGTMMYEALTGTAPFIGNMYSLAVQKQTTDPPPPSDLVSGVPDDLNSLCMDLLHRDPGKRPTASDILRRLGGEAPQQRTTPTTPRPYDLPFVGRVAQLRLLHEAAALARGGGQPVAVLVHARSGLGKTALVRQFLGELQSSDHSAVVLNGRCYEHESVPYKALDSLVDDLMQYLRRLNALEVKAVLPTDSAAVARLFPVMEEIEAVKKARLKAAPIIDPQEVRQRAFAALREMASRISDDHSLVLFLDDLQWGDRDSAQLIGEMLRPPLAPPLLLIGTYRPEEAEESAFLSEFRKLGGDRAFGEVREMALEELKGEEAQDLARAVAGSSASAERIEAIAREAAGSPFFIQELARFSEGTAEREDNAASLDDVIRARVGRLPESAQHLLEIVAVAGQPVGAEPAIAAAGIEENAHPLIAALRADNLVRTRIRAGREELVTYHDRVREAVVDRLEPSRRKECHLRLALALERFGGDPEILSTHFERAGQPERAAAYAFDAGDLAAKALAFDLAARLYRFAIGVLGIDSVPVERLIQLAEALGNAGRGADAAHHYLLAAGTVDPTRALELRRNASEHLLRSGHVDEGMRIMVEVLASVGMKLPATRTRAILGIIARRLFMRMRGFGYDERAPEDLSPELLMRVDVSWAVTIGLARIDNIRSAYFQSIQMLLALKLGDPYRVARALGVEAGMASIRGGPGRKHSDALLEKAERHSRRVGHPHVLGLAKLSRATISYFSGQFRMAVRESEEAEKIFREQCTGVTWEIDTSQIYTIYSLEYLGNLRELAHRIPLLLHQAEERGDRYHTIHFSARPNMLWLAQDDPDTAQRYLASVAANRPREAEFAKSFHFPQFVELFARSQIDFYRGHGMESWRRIEERWPEQARWMSRFQFMRIEGHHLRARCGLAAAAETGDKSILAVVQREAKAIAGERMPWSLPLAESVRAGVHAARGRDDRARELYESAARNFEKADMSLFGAAAKRRFGELTGGENGRALTSAADAWMSAQGVKAPERLTRVLMP
jgi:serine/threonine protein kinase